MIEKFCNLDQFEVLAPHPKREPIKSTMDVSGIPLWTIVWPTIQLFSVSTIGELPTKSYQLPTEEKIYSSPEILSCFVKITATGGGFSFLSDYCRWSGFLPEEVEGWKEEKEVEDHTELQSWMIWN